VHLVGFIIKKFVTMHGLMNVKFVNFIPLVLQDLVLWQFILSLGECIKETNIILRFYSV